MLSYLKGEQYFTEPGLQSHCFLFIPFIHSVVHPAECQNASGIYARATAIFEK
jgi:hypothetical protein